MNFQHTLAQFFKKNLRELLWIAVGAILLVLGSYHGYTEKVTKKEQMAADEMVQALTYFKEQQWGKALEGDGISLGFEEITTRYPTTPAANEAYYHAGVCALYLGEHALALEHLQKFHTTEKVHQAIHLKLLGDAYRGLKKYTEAAAHYEKAATCGPNKEFSPPYWLLAAEAHAQAADFAAAIKCCETIIHTYPRHPAARKAKLKKAYFAGL